MGASRIQIYVERVDSPWHERWISRDYGSVETFVRYGLPKADATYRLEINSIERPYADALAVYTVHMSNDRPHITKGN